MPPPLTWDSPTGPSWDARGDPGGPPGEVSAAQLTATLAGAAQNPIAVSGLTPTAGLTYNQAQVQQIMDKLDELLAALKRR